MPGQQRKHITNEMLKETRNVETPIIFVYILALA